MWAILNSNSIRCLLRHHLATAVAAAPSTVFSGFSLNFMESHKPSSSSVSASSYSSRSGGRRRGLDMEDSNTTERQKGRGRGSSVGGAGKDKIDSLGRLLTRILRHMASELKLDMRNDGFVKVADLLKLNLKTFANIPLSSHTIDDVKEAVRKDNKQRFSLLEEEGQLWIRANQGHSIKIVETESLLKPILSAEEIPGMRRDVNVLIFLDVKKALEDGMKLYISDNKVILTEGFDGVVPTKYFQKVVSWPDRELITM